MLHPVTEALGCQPDRFLNGLRRPHTESIMVLGREGEKPDPPACKKIHPSIGIEVSGIEKLIQHIVCSRILDSLRPTPRMHHCRSCNKGPSGYGYQISNP